jgi:hypothetical protein
VNAHPQARRDFARRVTALRHLLDRCDLELLCVPLSAHTFSLCPELWLRSVYNCRGDSVNISIEKESRREKHSSVDEIKNGLRAIFSSEASQRQVLNNSMAVFCFHMHNSY